MVFLHGVLLMEIIEGKGLPNLDGFGILSRDKSDPYCTVDIRTNDRTTHRVAKTRVIDNDLNPKWNERFKIPVCHDCGFLEFRVKDEDYVSSNDMMGSMMVRGRQILDEKKVEGWFPLTGTKKGKNVGKIRICLVYKPYVAGSIETNVVGGTIFPMRKGCDVKLYQDAHTPAVPPITDIVDDHTGKSYRPTQLFRDIERAIRKARKFVYIVGWSLKVDLPLVRGGDGCGGSTGEGGGRGGGDSEDLGVILKRKASEGVRVLIMIWDDPGVMNVHDEETNRYFKGSDVIVLKAPRRSTKKKVAEKLQNVTMSFTHHQKCVMMDGEIPHSDDDSNISGGGSMGSSSQSGGSGSRRRRQVVGFCGGIDLTLGRYDTPEHDLYRTLPTTHRRDFYNKVVPGATADTGPRQPWHDVHMYVEGEAAMDLVTNFVERWNCQAGAKLKSSLARMDETEYDLARGRSSSSNNPSSWNVQMFRSINEDSVQFDYNALGKLPGLKGKHYEATIEKAYIHHIRRARRFIYIENQYFIGSSHSWMEPEKLSPNMIPIEITARILNAIFQREEFRVYIVLPLHSEGDPCSAVTQEILHFQQRTVQMMYHRIAKAIDAVGIQAHPTDYLCFFSLGKREGPSHVPCSLAVDNDGKSLAANLRRRLRFMIYVHSKMAVFDDEYIIIGTANINERSMSGNRDTEIAFGAYQPRYTKEKMGGDKGGKPINGKVHTFRLALWAEHCGEHMEVHRNPAAEQCMSTMRHMAAENLKRYLRDDLPPEYSSSHLLLYPYNISRKGAVTCWKNCPTFPDVGGEILGKNATFVPDSLAT